MMQTGCMLFTVLLAATILGPCLMTYHGNSVQQPNPQQNIELQDVAGDVAAPNTGQPDIVKVAWESDGRNLILRITFYQDLEQSLRKSMETKGIAFVYFDTDNRRETGDEAEFFSESPGFELQSAVASGIRFKDGYTSWGTNTSRPSGRRIDVSGYYISASLRRYKQRSTGEEITEPKGSRGEMAGNTAVVKYSYDQLGVSSGQIIRIAFSKWGTKFVNKESFLPEVNLVLR